MRFLRKALQLAGATALALGMLVTLRAAAQTDVTTGRFAGQVVDQEGQPLPGVAIEARNKGTGLVKTQVTDARGLYRILDVPAGTYEVKAALSGFMPQTKPGVVITVGSAVTADFRLALAGVAETVTVTGATQVVETTQTSSQTTVDVNAIKSLPINGRNFTDFVLTTPNSQREGERGNLALGGQRGINTNVTLDGVDYNDAFFGGSSGDGSAEGRAPFTLSQESVREFQVIQNGASVEFGRSGGGFVNVVTKSGNNDFHGSAFFYDRPQSTMAKFANGTEPKDQSTRQFGASIGGAVAKDKLFFFGSWDQQKQSITIPITGALVLDPDIAAKYPSIGTTDPAFVQEQNGKVFFGRLDFQASDSQRFYVRGNYAKYEGPNGTSSGQNNAPSHNGLEGLETSSYVFSWAGNFGSNLINDMNFQYAKNDIPRQDQGLGLPEIQLGRSSVYGALGEVAFLPIVATDNRYSLNDTVTYLYGAHAIKVGFDYNNTGMDQVFKGNWRGVFVFDYPTADQTKAAILAGKWTQYREFIGLNGLTVDQAGTFSQRQKELAVFLQDQWYATPSLTVTAGLRYERLDNPDDPVLAVNKVTTPGARNVQPDAKIPDVNDQWSPRLSVAWSPGKEAKSVVRFSVGRYWSRTPAILFAQLYTSNGVRGTQYQVNAGATGPQAGLPAPGWGATFDPSRTQQLGNLPPGTALPAPGVFGISSDFTNPHTDRVTLGAERDVMGISFGLEGAWAKGYDLERNADANLAAAPMSNCPKLDPNAGVACYGSSATGTGQNRLNGNYGRMTVYTSDARSDFKSLTLSLRKNFANGFRFFGSITRGSDYDTDSNERNYAGFTLWDPNNPEVNWGPSVRDIRWRGTANASYERSLGGNLSLNTGLLFWYQTGKPYTAFTGTDDNKDGNTTDRATINGEVVGRDTFNQPDQYQVDLRVGLGYKLGPGMLGVYLDIFNLTNTGNRTTSLYNYPGSGSSAFGTLNGFTTTPRTLQFSARYDF